MRWFKHLTTAHDDPALSTIVEEMGSDGYGIYWLLLEHFAAAMPKDCKSVPEITRSIDSWAKICACRSTRQFDKFYQTAVKLRLICGETAAELRQNCSKRAAKRLQICIPKLLKYRDEYSKKSGQTPEKIRSDSRKNPAVDTERDTEYTDSLEYSEPENIQAMGDILPPHPPSKREGDARAEPRLVKVIPEHWDALVGIARGAGMRWPKAIEPKLREIWRRLPVGERLIAIEGIAIRVECGEYADPAFVPKLPRYLEEQLWTEETRPKPQARAPTKDEEYHRIFREMMEANFEREENQHADRKVLGKGA